MSESGVFLPVDNALASVDGLRREIQERQVGSVVAVSLCGCPDMGSPFHFHVGCLHGIGEERVPPQWDRIEVYTFNVMGNQRQAYRQMMRECPLCGGRFLEMLSR